MKLTTGDRPITEKASDPGARRFTICQFPRPPCRGRADDGAGWGQEEIDREEGGALLLSFDRRTCCAVVVVVRDTYTLRVWCDPRSP
jgi:hypothetical protein